MAFSQEPHKRVVPFETWRVPVGVLVSASIFMTLTDLVAVQAGILNNVGLDLPSAILITLPVATLPISLILLLPRTANDSSLSLVRMTGRIPLLLRYALLLVVIGMVFLPAWLICCWPLRHVRIAVPEFAQLDSITAL